MAKIANDNFLDIKIKGLMHYVSFISIIPILKNIKKL